MVIAGNEVIGFFVVSHSCRYLHQLHIAPAMQKKGVGTLVLKHLQAIFAKGFTLHVGVSKVSAQRFYQRHGLQPGEESPNPMSGRPRIEYVFPGFRLESNTNPGAERAG